MKQKLQIIITVFLLGIFFSACSIDPHYEAEKAFWHAEQNAREILQKSKGKPSNEELAQIIKGYQRVCQVAPLDNLSASSKRLIVNIYLSQKDYDNAHKELKSIIENFSMNQQIATKTFFTKGKIYEMEEKFDEAFLEYEKILDLYPLSQVGLDVATYLYKFSEKHKETLKYKWTFAQTQRHYQQLIEEYKDSRFETPLKNYLLRLFFIEKKWEEVIDFWEDTPKEDAEAPEVMRSKIAQADVFERKLKENQKAIDLLNELITTYPDHEYTRQIELKLAGAYFRLKEYEDTNKIINSLIKKHPEDTDLIIRSRQLMIKIAQEKKENEKVIKSLKQLKIDYPDHPGTLATTFSLFLFYNQLKDEENSNIYLIKAVTEYETTWKNGGKEKIDLTTGQLLLFCYYHQNQYELALKLLEELTIRFPGNPRFELTMAQIYLEQYEEKDKAKEIYFKLLKKYPKDKRLQYTINNLIAKLNQTNQIKS